MRKLNHFLIGVFSLVCVCATVVLLTPSVGLAWDSQKLIICHITSDGDAQTRVLSKYDARRHLENHPEDTAGICPVACVGQEPIPVVNCPCSGLEAGNAVWGPDFPVNMCDVYGPKINLTSWGFTMRLNSGVKDGEDFCSLYERYSGEDSEEVSYSITVTPEQAEACTAQLIQFAEDAEITCKIH
jgi:hypothetical protein